MFVATVPAKVAADAIRQMLREDLIERSMRIQRSENEVMIPLRSERLPAELVDRFSIRIEERGDRRRFVRENPFVEIRNDLAEAGLKEGALSKLPDRWEMIGDVLMIKLPDELMLYATTIAEAYARVLNAKSVLRDLGAIHGEVRLPETQPLLGTDTRTMHLENEVLFALDAARIMFSSGNIEERMRMGAIDCDGEVVLDMFAGIGYFSIPMAVHHKPKRIFSCEIRELSYNYLVENIGLNKVEGTVQPVLGDNREFDPPMKADRIVMGYLRDTYTFLPKALRCLKSGGVVHYHENFPNAVLSDMPITRLREAAGEQWNFEILRKKVVKTFSPGVSHVVVDARFTSS